MIDFVKIQLQDEPEEILNRLRNIGAEITGEYDLITGEIKKYPLIAVHGELTVKIKSKEFIELQGSIHKLHNHINNICRCNHNDFTLNNLLTTVIDLHEDIALNPFASVIRNVEFGVNLSPPFPTKRFLRQILNYKGNNFNEMKSYRGNTLGIECYLNQYGIKLYCKKTQYWLPDETMRVEVKVKKMEWLKEYGITFFSDLLHPVKLMKLGSLLTEIFSEIILIDTSVDTEQLTKPQRRIVEGWHNPKYIEELQETNRERFEHERRKFRAIQRENTRDNIQENVTELIRKKVAQLLTINNETGSNYFRLLSHFRKEKTSTFLTDFPIDMKNKILHLFDRSINRSNPLSNSNEPRESLCLCKIQS